MKIFNLAIRGGQSVAQNPRFWSLTKQLVPLSIGFLCLWLLTQRMADMDIGHIMTILKQVSLAQWLAASGATALSFWAVGRYDAVVHRHWRTGYSSRAAAYAGVSSIALAQTLGLGVLTGAVARWRMMPDLGLAMATKISATVAISFLAGWSLITALANLVLDGPQIPVILLILPLICFAVFLGVAFLHPQIHISRWRISLPSLTAIGAITALTLIDTAAAAAALQLLLPSTITIEFQTLFPVFLIALGAALMSGTPGGVGPFELTMLALLPAAPEADLIGAILAFRILYYAIPACFALAALARPPRFAPRSQTAELSPYKSDHDPILRMAKRSEIGLLRQGDATLITGETCDFIALETGQTLSALFDPARGTITDTLSSLKGIAKLSNRVYCMYKCSPREALFARFHGMKLLHIADEALLDPSRFSLNTPAFRQLRRKLRHADKSDLRIEHASVLPIAEMAEIDALWSAQHGTAHGATMGRFEAQYLAQQQVYLAYQGPRLLGFISLHQSDHELCLDVMRAHPDAPDGMMHALVYAAIEQAARDGRNTFSLAALPAKAPNAKGLEKYLRAKVNRLGASRGLTQFKTCFKPRLQPLYMVAPSWAAMVLSLADLTRAIHFPPKISPLKGLTDIKDPTNPAQQDYDNYEIAPRANM